MSTQNKHTPMITLSKGGSGERTEKLETLQIPDCYCIVQTIKKCDPVAGKMLNDCWHLAHDLKRHALELEECKAELYAELEKLAAWLERSELPRNLRYAAEARAAIAKAKGGGAYHF